MTIVRVLFLLSVVGLLTGCASGDRPSARGPRVAFLNAAGRPETLPFSEAVRVGPMLYLSGQLGVRPGTTELVEGGIEAEAEQTLENIRATLVANGYAMRDVVKCTVMLADIAEWAAFNAVYVQHFEAPFPARSAFGADGLAFGARVEVECMAARERRAAAD